MLFFGIVFAATFLDLEDMPKEIAEYMVKVGARVPGVRPGNATVEYFRETQSRARFAGGFMLASLATIASLADGYVPKPLALRVLNP